MTGKVHFYSTQNRFWLDRYTQLRQSCQIKKKSTHLKEKKGREKQSLSITLGNRKTPF
jgi:hypothetical protein